jgi:hypothetical protein
LNEGKETVIIIIKKMVLGDADIRAISDVVFFAPLGIKFRLRRFSFNMKISAFSVLERLVLFNAGGWVKKIMVGE